MDLLLIIIIPIVIVLFIFIQSFFSNSEMAMVSSNRIRLKYLANNGDRNAKIILNLLDNPERLFGTTLVGINLATVISTALSDFYFKKIIYNKIIEFLPFIDKIISIDTLISFIMVPSVLIFGELFPMSIARKYPNTMALRNAKFIKIGYLTFFPLMLVVSNISKLVGLLFKTKASEFGKLTREELQLIVAGRFGNIKEKTKKIINEVFDINELTAEDVMVHLNEVKMININATVKELRELTYSTNFSRFPVYSEDIFNIVATIHSLNILGANDNENISNYIEKLYIVPSSKPVIQILSELKRNRKYMAIVVDEFGVACGILTIEDIVKKIVGDINEDVKIRNKESEEGNDYIFDAKMDLKEFYEKTGIDFTDENVSTLNGIISLALGRIGRKNERVVYKNVEFEIIDATDRSVKLIKLLKK